MPDLKQITDEVKEIELKGSPFDIVRRKYIKALFEKRKRNVIIYYSGWLQKPPMQELSILDYDINGFMTTIHEMDKTKGLDLILHTPGGDLAATEIIVNYLRKTFDCNISAFVPQLAMSAGTMIACSCKEIYMGKQSSLGPIDPQFYLPNIGQIAAQGVVEEVERAVREINENPASQVLWANILSKYNPTFIGNCEKAIEWSKEITTEWLQDCMFKGEKNAAEKAIQVVEMIASHEETKSHSRHLTAEKCKEIGLKIVDLEDDQILQDIVLSIHHACMVTLQTTNVIKIIENQNDKIFMTRIGNLNQ